MIKEYDIIVFGATGFTGKLICEYLSKHEEVKNIKWAIAGRNKYKLEQVVEEFNLENIEVLEVDSFDNKAIDSMCSKTKLVLTTVGPYNLYGEYLVKSCISHDTHYVDLTGEPEFVNKIRTKYSDLASQSKSIIINSCGLESIIPDLGVYQTVKKMKSDFKDVTYFMKTKGEISGGTWASFVNSISNGKELTKLSNKPQVKKKVKKVYFSKECNAWAIIFPVIDKQVVYRTSKCFKEYGSEFSFNEYMLMKSFWQIIVLIKGVFLVAIISKIGFVKKWLLSLKPSGSGPSKEKRDSHWFEAIFIGKNKDEKIRYKISGGDPGYGETSKFISEIALCILLQEKELVKNKGILTPVECTGELLIKRLEKAGIKFEYF